MMDDDFPLPPPSWVPRDHASTSTNYYSAAEVRAHRKVYAAHRAAGMVRAWDAFSRDLIDDVLRTYNAWNDTHHGEKVHDPAKLSEALEGAFNRLDERIDALSERPPAPPRPKYDDVLVPFVAMMRGELHANAHKGDRKGWLDMSRDESFAEIQYHLTKLRKALALDDPARIQEHAADVANGAMMLADVCRLLGTPPRAPEQAAQPKAEPVDALREAHEALRWLLANIRSDAPQLSGKAMGNAERVMTLIDAARLVAQPKAEPVDAQPDGRVS